MHFCLFNLENCDIICVQTTFRVGLALLKGVEKELLSADFEQVRCCHCCALAYSNAKFRQ